MYSVNFLKEFIESYPDHLEIDISNIAEKKPTTLTVCIMTFNEERCIERCIESIKNIADEIILVDTGSNDNTINIVKNEFPQVVIHSMEWTNDFSDVRNFLSQEATSDWIMQLDADEYFIDDHASILKNILELFSNLTIDNLVLSPRLTNTDLSSNSYTNRIYKNHSFFRYYGLVHEELRFAEQLTYPLVILSIPFYHDGYVKEIIEDKNKYLRNYDLLSEMVKKEPLNSRWYYFLSREMILLEMSEVKVRAIIEKGLGISDKENIFYKMGLMYNLLSISNENTRLINNGISEYPECIDFPYYLLINKINKIVYSLTDDVKRSIQSLMNLETSISFINSNGDHFLLLWFDIYIMIGEYDLAFNMLTKIKSLEYKTEGLDRLKEIRNTIDMYLRDTMLGEEKR